MKKNGKQKDNETLKTVLLVILIILCLISAFTIYYFNTKVDKDEKELAYTELITSINEGKIEKIEMTTGSSTVKVTLKGEGEEKDRQKSVIVPSIQAFTELIQEKVDKENVQIELNQKSDDATCKFFI